MNNTVKKLISAVALAALAASAVCTVTVNAQEDKKMSFDAVSGRWTITSDSITGGGAGNVFCMSDYCVGKSDSWQFTAKVKTKSGAAAGIVFGVNNPQKPLSRWHCVNIGQRDNYSAMFRETDSRNDYYITRPLTQSEREAEWAELKLVCIDGKTVTGYVNNNPTYTYTTQDYNGGYFGVMCCEAQAEFKDISIKEIEPASFNSITTDIEMDLPFDKTEDNYWATVENDVKNVTINASGNGDITINGNYTQSATVALNIGLNTIPVTISAGETDRTVYYNIVRRKSPAQLYNESFRAGLHFSPEMFSINDPNGLIYDENTGIYHLFFQCDYAFRGYKGGGETKSWGHCISRNLIDWEELDLAITPDESGVIWSGSGVIDRNNTSGLFDESTPAGSRMVFLFTYYNSGSTEIGLAYSKDFGRTFIKAEAPVIADASRKYTGGFRDPKVVWYSDDTLPNGGKWLLIGCGERAFILSSDDLLHWEKESVIKGIDGKALVTECPDLFPMNCDGETKWVLYAAGVWYVIGNLAYNESGKLTFIAETDKTEPCNGVKELWAGSGINVPENYAAQTFYNTADGRRIQMSWMRDFYGTAAKLWWNMLSLPTELKLEKLNGKYRITYHPIAELAQKHSQKLADIKDATVTPQDSIINVNGSYLDIIAEIDKGDAEQFGFNIYLTNDKAVKVYYDAESNSVITDKTAANAASRFVYSTPLKKNNGDVITLRIVLDNSILEVWANDECYQAGTVYMNTHKDDCTFFVRGGSVTVKSLQVYGMDKMNRSSMTQENELLQSIYSRLQQGGETAKAAYNEYNLLTPQQKFLLPADAEALAQQASGYSAPDTKPTEQPQTPDKDINAVPFIAGGAIVLAGGAAALVGVNKKKKK